MKGISMKAPGISEIYSQRLMHDLHLKKLDRIREQRKTQLGFDHTRLSHLENIRKSKSKSFAHKFNEQNMEINKSNLKLLGKLQKVKPFAPFARYTSYSSYENDQKTENPSNSFIKPYIKKRILETQKENNRIYNKMRSLSSSLNKDWLLRDYARSQQIKTRITRYANQNNKIQLKSQKYLPLDQSKVSRDSQNTTEIKSRKQIPSFYKKEEILKNKVDGTNTHHLKFRQNRRPQTSVESANQQNKDKGFFATEPSKIKRRVQQQKKIYI